LKVIPKLVNIGIGDIFIADEKLLSLILGLWLLVYCYRDDISGIKAAAFWGILGILVYLVLNIVLLLFASYWEDIPEDLSINYTILNWYSNDVYSCIACIILSFSFHTYAFPIYECLDTPDRKKMIVTSSIGIFISMLIYLLVGTIGYVLYGSDISDSILDSMGMNSLAVLVNISFVVNVVMSFPLTFNALKHYFMFLIEIIVSLIARSCCKKAKKKDEELVESTLKTQKTKRSTQISKISEGHAKNNENNPNDDPHKDINDSKNHSSHGGLEIVHIPHSIEYIIIFVIFCTIFFTAVRYPDMKTVRLIFNKFYFD
jgi:amino acid permease